MAQTALVVSGGGSKGAFAVGAIEYLMNDLGITFDMVLGSSTGALISPLVIIGDLALLKKIYTSVHTSDILERRRVSEMLGSSSVYSTRPLERLIGRNLTPTRSAKVLTSSIKMIVAGSCLQTGRVTYFYTGNRPKVDGTIHAVKIRNRNDLMRAILASSNQPVLMPPVKVPKNVTPLRQYVDGGVREIAPIKMAIDNGATDIYAIVLSPERPASKNVTYRDLIQIAGRSITMLTDEIVLNDVRTAEILAQGSIYLRVLREQLIQQGLNPQLVSRLLRSPAPGVKNPMMNSKVRKLIIIRPKGELPSDGLEFEPQIMKRMMNIGYARARAILS